LHAAYIAAYWSPFALVSLGPLPDPPEAVRPEGWAQSAANNPMQDEMTAQIDSAVAKGLASLAREQNADGSFGSMQFGRNVAVTSLGCLAFMADGNLPGRGAYGEVVSKGLEYVLANCSESGLVATPNAKPTMIAAQLIPVPPVAKVLPPHRPPSDTPTWPPIARPALNSDRP
jgi:hypothetical protein